MQVGRRTVRGHLQYRVHWAGYSDDSDDDTWEPLSNLWGVRELIEEYEEAEEAKAQHE
jgi:hypothetical protein